MATKEKITDRLKLITKQISGQAELDDGFIIESYHIKGNGYGFFLSYIDKTFIKVARQTEVFMVSENFNQQDKHLVYTYTHELIFI